MENRGDSLVLVSTTKFFHDITSWKFIFANLYTRTHAPTHPHPHTPTPTPTPHTHTHTHTHTHNLYLNIHTVRMNPVMIANQTTYKVLAFLKQHCWCPGLYGGLVYMVSWSMWCPGQCAWTEVSTVTVEMNGVLKPHWINCSSVDSCCFELFCTWYCVLTLLIYKLNIAMWVGCVL